MTWVTWGMSSPRAATSVATSMGVLPDLKLLRAYIAISLESTGRKMNTEETFQALLANSIYTLVMFF